MFCKFGKISNPFVNNLRFSYYLTDASYIKLEVYDHAGRMIKRLAGDNMAAGEYTYLWEAVGVSAGNYFISLNCGKSREVIQCVKLDD